ncbi:MAG: FlgD immunoglobulin-like domain containing protein, partial [Ignavibacteriaceae bacterium]
FLLRGAELPDEVKIKIYTIAGRLVWDFEVPNSEMTPGFNRIYWDGKDQDGDDVANGVYLYKVIASYKDETKTVTQKLARVQ